MNKGDTIMEALSNLADELYHEAGELDFQVVLHPDDFAALVGRFDAPPSATLLQLGLSTKLIVMRSPRIRPGVAEYSAVLHAPVYEWELYDGLEDAVSRAEE